MKQLLFVIILTSLFTGILIAQDTPDTTIVLLPDSILTDTLPVKEGFFKKNYPDPMKAGLMSLVIPGAGQIYNKSWWKAPLVWGAIGGMTYVAVYNTQVYNNLQEAYQLKLKGEEHQYSGTSIDNAQTLRSLRDQYDKNRQLSYFGIFIVYFLNGVEAFVDAHLKNFDISDDLSLQVKPQIGVNTFTQSPTLGLGVTIPLNSSRQYKSLEVRR